MGPITLAKTAGARAGREVKKTRRFGRVAWKNGNLRIKMIVAAIAIVFFFAPGGIIIAPVGVGIAVYFMHRTKARRTGGRK